MTTTKDQEYFETYLHNLNEDEDDNEEIHAIKHDFNAGHIHENEDNEDTIVMQNDGNYYFQAPEKITDTKSSKIESEGQTKITSASKRRNLGQTVSGSNKRTKLTPTPSRLLKTEELIQKPVDETITPEIDNQVVYDFDENEANPDDPDAEEDDVDYKTKGLIKKVKEKKGNDTKFTCMMCPYQTSKKFLLSRHLKTHSDERPYKCSVCERGFKTNASLQNHRNTHLGIKPHACKECDSAFTTSGELVRHVRYRHTHIKPHKCTECDYSSVEMSKLRRHMRCHTGERPYQCPHCTYASPDLFKLKRHMRIHTGEKPYECDICHARFTQSNSLKHHRLIHSVNEKPVFQCHLCPTTCGRKTDLRLHIRNLHQSDQPIPCKRCGKELPDRYTYKMHIKTHEGEKCHRCDYCPYASISKRHLDTHILIHLDSKPFICEICQTTFRQKCLLARHMKIYHSANYAPPEPRKKDHKCPHCNKMFAFNGNLIRHMEIHDPTSHVAETKEKLKLGRMTRILSDGTVVKVPSKFTDQKETYLYDGTEEQQEFDDNELQEEEQYGEEEAEYTEENIQFIYDEIEDDEDGIEVQLENNEEEDEEANEDNNVMDVKVETMETIITPQPNPKHFTTVKPEVNNDSHAISLELQDGQDFMVIEVLPEDDEDEEQLQEQELVKVQQPPKPKTSNKKTTVIKSHKNSQPLISDYFGFEYEEEDDEETKGAIKLLEMIEED